MFDNGITASLSVHCVVYDCSALFIQCVNYYFSLSIVAKLIIFFKMIIETASDGGDVTVENLLIKNQSDLKVLYFYIEDSAECKQMTDVIKELDNNEENKNITFVKIEATKGKDICKKYDVHSAPTFLFYLNGKAIDKLVGANVPALIKKVKENKEKQVESAAKEDLDSRLQKLIKKAPVMLFMKGNPSTPRCGFSKQVIALLNSHNAKYETFDILEDWDVREGLKKFSNWPTYPQLYISGELIGGLDILKELSENGELDELLKSAC